MAVQIRVMEEADIDEADRMLCLAFGRTGFLSQIHLHRSFEPESVWVAHDAGRIVGSVSAVMFDRLAYIGLMAVDPQFQRRGIARALMDHALAAIDGRGCPLTLLDATDEGAPLYESLGFVDDATAYVYERQARGPVVRASGDVDQASERDLAEIIALDTPIFGADRSKLLQVVWRQRPHCFVKRGRSNQLEGYLFARDAKLGPWVAVDTSVAEELLSAALAIDWDKGPFVLVPRSNEHCRKLLSDHGFVERRRLRHMRRGGNAPPGKPMQLYAQASFAHG